MKLVNVERTDSGYFLDPRPYQAWLAESGDRLPAGAMAFAADPGHYDFASVQCVKDLKLSAITVEDAAGQVSVEVRFAPNDFKHDSGLRIRYEGVVSLSVDAVVDDQQGHPWPGGQRLGDLQLDEILPHEQGCSHEIAMTAGKIWIVASDLHASWTAE